MSRMIYLFLFQVLHFNITVLDYHSADDKPTVTVVKEKSKLCLRIFDDQIVEIDYGIKLSNGRILEEKTKKIMSIKDIDFMRVFPTVLPVNDSNF